MAKPLLYNFYVETTKEDLEIKRGFSNETFIEFLGEDIEKIKRKCYRHVFFDYMTKDIDDIFYVRVKDKMYLQKVLEQSTTSTRYQCYRIYDIFSDVTEVAFRIYVGMKEKQVYNPDPKGYIDCTPVFIDATVSNDKRWPFVAVMYCFEKRNVNVFII